MRSSSTPCYSCGTALSTSITSPSKSFSSSTSSLKPGSYILALRSSGLTFSCDSIHRKKRSRCSTNMRRSHSFAWISKLITMPRMRLISSGDGFSGFLGGSSSLLVLSSFGFHLSSSMTLLKKSRPPWANSYRANGSSISLAFSLSWCSLIKPPFGPYKMLMFPISGATKLTIISTGSGSSLSSSS